MKKFRRIPLTGTENTRDLGGYPLANGKSTVYGKFLRSAFPSGLTPEDESLLLEMGITTVIDLRSETEQNQAPCHFTDKPGFIYHNLHLSGGDLMQKGEEYMSPAYMAISKCENMPKVFRILANAPAGCLFHCAAGKDRTGTLAAILLLLAGAEETDIVVDYMVTHTYIEKMIQELKKLPDFPLHLLQSKPQYMAEFLRLFREDYGSPEEYLSGIGLTPEEIEKLKRKLVA